MKTFSYPPYFFYIALNWNWRIAWHIIISEIKGEKKYGINTTGADKLKHLEKKGIDINHATIYMAANYELLDIMFKQLTILTTKPLNHFLDIGCGKGRALCVAAHYNCQKVSGIDFSKEFCDKANENLFITKQKIPALQYKIINNDAFYYNIPGDVDCIFLFNPFDEIIMSGVVQNIITSLENRPREIYIAYINPLYNNLFIKAGFKQLYHFRKMKYLELVLLKMEIDYIE